MPSDVKQVFYFHAEANSMGGVLEEPFRYVPTPSSVGLSSAGGSVTQRAEPYRFEEIHAGASYTHVSGRPVEDGGPWVQRATCVVEGVRLTERVSVGYMVSQIHIEHPAGGGTRRISFAGSSIRDLRVDGKLVDIEFNPTLLPDHGRDGEPYNQDASVKAELAWPVLWQQSSAQAAEALAVESTPQWYRERYGWCATTRDAGAVPAEGYALCSLVNKTEGLAPEQHVGHCIELPDCGRIILGEILVYPQLVSLTMLRGELDCGSTTGVVCFLSIISNGTTVPPS